MKYQDLPSEEIIVKLISTSFENPMLNYQIYKWGNAILPLIKFRESERVKLIKKYGSETEQGIRVLTENIDKFREEYIKVLEMDITEELPKLNLNESDFESCCYPKEKSMWLNAKEIATIIDNAEKEKQGE